MRLHWHRRDLRLADNPALAAAAAASASASVSASVSASASNSASVSASASNSASASASAAAAESKPGSGSSGDDGVQPLVVIDPGVLAYAGPPRVVAWCEALASLRSRYRERGGDLLVLEGDPASVVPAVADALGASAVHWERDYSGLATERDEAVADALATRGLDAVATHGAVCHPPGTITTAAGEPYQVFSYYWRKWADRPVADPPPAPDGDALADPDAVAAAMADGDAGEHVRGVGLGALPAPVDLAVEDADLDTDDADRPDTVPSVVPSVAPETAHDRLEAFCAGPIYTYADERDRPAADATSRLSGPLSFGTIGPRTVLARVNEAEADAADAEVPESAARDSVEAFRRQLAWREFYAQVLWANPGNVAANHRDFANPIPWREAPADLAAWKRGETGYPLVDAGMRQLATEAWMHNRVRMVVASFLTKHLRIDWREGYAHFRERLVDHDPGNDSGGWQWAAGTGTDAQPYFRVFNPMSQCERYDPDGTYVARHVPELADVPAPKIHDWPTLPEAERAELAPSYPDPIVEHGPAREAAIEMFERAREG